MNISKAFRMLILVFSFLMFIWQASIAVSKLMDPPVVDSTERLNMANIEPPLITICHLEQWNITKLKHYGYHEVTPLLNGISHISGVPTLVCWGISIRFVYFLHI